MAKRKLHVLDVRTKVKVIEDNENGLTVKQLTKKYCVGKTQVYEILKKKEEIRTDWLHGNGSVKRKLRETGNEEINRIIFEWFVTQRSKNLPVSGPILQEQAKKVAVALNNFDFKASNGWLRSFRERHGIVFKEPCGEAGDAKEDTVIEWKEKNSNLIKDYDPQNIANADETGLLFRALPSKTLCLKDNVCSGGKLGSLQTALNKAKFTGICAKDYTVIDNEIATDAPSLSMEQMIEVHHNQNTENCSSSDSEEEGAAEPQLRVTTYHCALTLLKDIEKFCLQKDDAEFLGHILSARKLVESRIASSVGCSQKKISDYLNKESIE